VSRPVRPHRPRPRPRHERRSLPGLPRSVRGRVSLQVGPTTPRVLSRRHRAVPVASSTLVAVPFQPPGELVRAHAMRRSIVGNFGHGATSAYHTAMPGPWSRRSQVGTTATTVIRRTISRWYQPRRFARPPFGSDFFRPQPQQSVRPCTLDPQDPAVRRLYVPASVLTMPRLTWFHVSTMSYLPVVQRTRTSPSAGSCSTPRPRLPATTEEANDPPAGPSGPPSRHLFSLTLHRNTPSAELCSATLDVSGRFLAATMTLNEQSGQVDPEAPPPPVLPTVALDPPNDRYDATASQRPQ
jgi:hypothetical protein